MLHTQAYAAEAHGNGQRVPQIMGMHAGRQARTSTSKAEKQHWVSRVTVCLVAGLWHQVDKQQARQRLAF